jgi:hypothetical protein
MAAGLALLAGPVAFGANPLFPRPLHLVRRIDDPISNTAATIDEYCAGNRVVTVRGSKVTIADYEAQQLTEIDHAALTWSVTSFTDIARSRTELEARIGNNVEPRAAHLTAMAHNASAYVSDEPHRRMEIGFDRKVVLSRAAAEVLIGAAYPNGKSQEQEEILAAAGGGSNDGVSAMSTGATASGAYGLLVERTLTIETGGTTLVSHNSVTRIGDEAPPAEAILIDQSATRVESRLTRLARELRDIDTIPSAKRH